MEDRLRGLAQEGLYADVEVKNIDVVVSSEKPGFVMLLNKWFISEVRGTRP